MRMRRMKQTHALKGNSSAFSHSIHETFQPEISHFIPAVSNPGAFFMAKLLVSEKKIVASVYVQATDIEIPNPGGKPLRR